MVSTWFKHVRSWKRKQFTMSRTDSWNKNVSLLLLAQKRRCSWKRFCRTVLLETGLCLWHSLGSALMPDVNFCITHASPVLGIICDWWAVQKLRLNWNIIIKRALLNIDIWFRYLKQATNGRYTGWELWVARSLCTSSSFPPRYLNWRSLDCRPATLPNQVWVWYFFVCATSRGMTPTPGMT